MPFLAPWFMLASAVAAVPLALHLLHRRRPQPVPFSTIRFLREAIASTRRSRNLTNLLTLLMRVLIVLLLAAAFSRPIVRFTTFIPEGKRTVVIVLDSSASMHLKDGEKSCFEHGKEWALKLVGSLNQGDRVAVLCPGAELPRAVFPPNSDHQAIARTIGELKPGYGPADLAESMNDLVAHLEEANRLAGIEIHLFSDYQRSGWRETEVANLAPTLEERGILLFLNRVTPTVAPNAAIVKASFMPPAILGEGHFEARATIRSSLEFSGPNTLRLVLNSAEQSRNSFQLPPETTVQYVLAAQAQGQDPYVAGQLELEADGFPLDDVYRFSLPRLPGIPVLLVDGSARGDEGRRDTFFLERAIQPRGAASSIFQPKVVDWPSFLSSPLTPYSVVYVCNPPALGETAAEKLLAFAAEGGTVVLMPGQHHNARRQPGPPARSPRPARAQGRPARGEGAGHRALRDSLGPREAPALDHAPAAERGRAPASGLHRPPGQCRHRVPLRRRRAPSSSTSPTSAGASGSPPSAPTATGRNGR